LTDAFVSAPLATSVCDQRFSLREKFIFLRSRATPLFFSHAFCCCFESLPMTSKPKNLSPGKFPRIALFFGSAFATPRTKCDLLVLLVLSYAIHPGVKGSHGFLPYSPPASSFRQVSALVAACFTFSAHRSSFFKFFLAPIHEFPARASPTSHHDFRNKDSGRLFHQPPLLLFPRAHPPAVQPILVARSAPDLAVLL